MRISIHTVLGFCFAALPFFHASSYGQDFAATRRVDIEWDKANADADAVSTDVKTYRSGIYSISEQTHLPILGIGSGPTRASQALVSQGDSYTAIIRLKDATLSIMGSANAIFADDAPPIADETTLSGQFSVAGGDEEDGVDLQEADFSFIKYNASYTLRIACTRSDDDRCKKPDFLRGTAASLVVIGGAK